MLTVGAFDDAQAFGKTILAVWPSVLWMSMTVSEEPRLFSVYSPAGSSALFTMKLKGIFAFNRDGLGGCRGGRQKQAQANKSEQLLFHKPSSGRDGETTQSQPLLSGAVLLVSLWAV